MSEPQTQSTTTVEVVTLDQFARILKAECRVQELEEALQSSTKLLQAYQAAEVESGVVNHGLSKQIAANEAALRPVAPK